MDGWTEKLARWMPQKREQTLDHAVRLVVDNGVSDGEKETATRQIQAAMEVDPKQLFAVIASVQGGGNASQADLEKAQAEAAVAQGNFEGLVKATQTLRETLTDMGLIGSADRLPETQAQWKEAVSRAVGREAQKLTAREQQLEKQRLALETAQQQALKQIADAEAKAQLRLAEIAKIAHNVYTGISGNLGISYGQLNALSFSYEDVQAHEPGLLVQGEGIFVGLWTLKFANGNSLGVACEVWAAPEDLKNAPRVDGLKTYNETVQAVALLRQWHGHDGGNFANEAAIIDSLDKAVKRHAKQYASAAGAWFEPAGADKWFIPSRILLDGKAYNANGNFEPVQDENLYDLRDMGAFQDTYTTQEGSPNAPWYWSSSEHRVHADYVWNVRFTDGHDDWDPKDNTRLSCRPVRVGRVRHLII